MQLALGVTTIWNSVPINLASLHQVGAMTVLSMFVYAMHASRRVDPRHIKNLLGKLRSEDPAQYQKMMAHYSKGKKLSAEDVKMANINF
jgi:hypothetical protein